MPRKTISRSKLGIRLGQFALCVRSRFMPAQDWTFQAALGLAHAFLALEWSEESKPGLNRARNHMEHAFREIIYARAQLSEDGLDQSVLTRYGRINFKNFHPLKSALDQLLGEESEEGQGK